MFKSVFSLPWSSVGSRVCRKINKNMRGNISCKDTEEVGFIVVYHQPSRYDNLKRARFPSFTTLMSIEQALRRTHWYSLYEYPDALSATRLCWI